MKKLGPSKIFLLTLFSILTIMGCANRGSGPQGGPKDTTPPRIIKYTPENNSTGISPEKIILSFDEIVLVENPYEKVIISPPQSKSPDIKALGHKISIELKDSLKENTTYTINFTDAIVDNNEKNKLEGFTYSFATGDYIDSLKISGTVIDAETLNPIPNIIVGIHSNKHDSSFTTTPFERITKTDSKGNFTIENVHGGSYHIYALSDIGNNYYYDIPTERIAFLDSLFIPSCEKEITKDTLFSYAYIDSTKQIIDSTKQKIDTIITSYNYKYRPNDVVLHSFIGKNTRQFLSQYKRNNAYNFSLYFGNTCDSLPTIRPLNLNDSSLNYILQTSENKDTLTYWIKDSIAWKTDTLIVETKYLKIEEDSTFWETDTLSLINKSIPPQNRKVKNIVKEEIPLFTNNSSSKFEIYNPLLLTFSMPTTINDDIKYQLQIKNDTIWENINSNLLKADSVGLKYEIKNIWQPSTTYKLKLDSGLFLLINGKTTKQDSIQFTTKSLEEYSSLIFDLNNYNGKEIIQILDKKDNVIREIKALNSKIEIKYLTPGTYYARLFLDKNNNNKWDTGSYKDKLQAETMYYFPYEIELRAFWDVEETWDIYEYPILEQKPEELIKYETK